MAMGSRKAQKFAVINIRSGKTMKTFTNYKTANMYRQGLRQPKNHKVKRC